MDEFKILSLHEENELTLEEKKKYYEKLRNYLEKRKLQTTTRGATTVAPKLKEITNKIAKKVTKLLAGKDVEVVSDGQENIPDCAVIFAHTHQGVLDNFAWIPETPRHTIILHSSVVNKLLVLAQLNTGLVLVNKDDKNNRLNAKLDMIELLQKGHSLAYFPESAWNLSPNKLHLPLNYGFLDVARKAGVPIIPVVDEYTYDTSTDKEKVTKIHIRFGKPIYVGLEDSLEEKLHEYTEQISTMRWELMEEKGYFKRKDISNEDYINYLKGNIKNLEMGGIDINVERRNIWEANSEFHKFFHVNDVPYDENGNLVETEEQINIRKRI